jgi:hypothetical protein
MKNFINSNDVYFLERKEKCQLYNQNFFGIIDYKLIWNLIMKHVTKTIQSHMIKNHLLMCNSVIPNQSKILKC